MRPSGYEMKYIKKWAKDREKAREEKGKIFSIPLSVVQKNSIIERKYEHGEIFTPSIFAVWWRARVSENGAISGFSSAFIESSSISYRKLRKRSHHELDKN
jgi:uncharacterized Fe-S cluster-containing MiaB family protein